MNEEERIGLERDLPHFKETDQVQEAYENYLESGQIEYFQELIELIDTNCAKKIDGYLRNQNRYDFRIAEEIRQEAKLEIWKEIEKTREGKGKFRYAFYWYARGIYRKCMARNSEHYMSDKNYLNREAGSIHNMKVDEDYVKIVGLVPKNHEEENEVLENERGLFYGKILDIYLQTLMGSDEPAENCLAVMYMRILPHILDIVIDSIMSSAKWARKLIDDKNIDQMTGHSENQMRANGYPFYTWGNDYLNRINQTVNINGKVAVLKTIKYLETFDKSRNLEHMDRDTHKIIQKKSFANLVKKPEFRALAVEYMSEDDRMYKLIGGSER